MQAQKAEGTRDLIGAEMRAWQKMQQIAAGVFEPFGFKPIETPAIEQVDVFVHGIGQSTDVVRKEMFRVFSGRQPGARLYRGHRYQAQAQAAPGASSRGHGWRGARRRGEQLGAPGLHAV